MGKNNKVVLAVRSSHGIELPLTDTTGKVLIAREHFDFVIAQANDKLVQNEAKSKKFHVNVTKFLAKYGEEQESS